MSFDETFRPSYHFHERDVFDVLGKPLRIREIRPSNFDGPVAEWANYREAVFNDSVTPIVTIPEGDGDDIHRVSWVHHSWLDRETESMHDQYHIACDCSMMAELEGDPDSIFECPTLQKTLNRRASLIRGTLLLDKIFRACRDSEDSRSQVTLDRQFFVVETIMWIMERDRSHPDSWVGNVASGEHTASLLGLILQEPPDNVRAIAEDLVDEGRLEFDGEIVRLPQAA